MCGLDCLIFRALVHNISCNIFSVIFPTPLIQLPYNGIMRINAINAHEASKQILRVSLRYRLQSIEIPAFTVRIYVCLLRAKRCTILF